MGGCVSDGCCIRCVVDVCGYEGGNGVTKKIDGHDKSQK